VSRRDGRRRANGVPTLEYLVPYLLLGQRWNGYRIPIVIQWAVIGNTSVMNIFICPQNCCLGHSRSCLRSSGLITNLVGARGIATFCRTAHEIRNSPVAFCKRHQRHRLPYPLPTNYGQRSVWRDARQLWLCADRFSRVQRGHWGVQPPAMDSGVAEGSQGRYRDGHEESVQGKAHSVDCRKACLCVAQAAREYEAVCPGIGVGAGGL
jgi:hypothetical protein